MPAYRDPKGSRLYREISPYTPNQVLVAGNLSVFECIVSGYSLSPVGEFAGHCIRSEDYIRLRAARTIVAKSASSVNVATTDATAARASRAP